MADAVALSTAKSDIVATPTTPGNSSQKPKTAQGPTTPGGPTDKKDASIEKPVAKGPQFEDVVYDTKFKVQEQLYQIGYILREMDEAEALYKIKEGHQVNQLPLCIIYW
jgi:hypothetical protein